MALIQPVVLSPNQALDSSSSRWYPLGLTKSADGIEDRQQQVMSGAGTISNVAATITAAPGAAKSYTLTLKKNKVATSLVLTWSGAAQVLATDTTHSVSFVAGDLLAWELTVVGAVAASTVASFYAEISGSNAQYFSANNFTASADQGLEPTFQASTNGVTASQLVTPWPVTGSITGFGLYQNGAGTTGSWQFLINKNGTDQDGSGGTVDTRVSISSSASPTTATGAFSLPVTAGDLIYIKAVAVSSPSVTKNMSWSFTFVPTDGVTVALPQAPGGATGGTAAGDEWCRVVSVTYNGTISNASEITTALGCSRTMFVSALYVNLDTAAGASKSRTFTVRKNGSDTSLAVAISGAVATSGNDTASGHKFNITNTDTLSLRDTIVGSGVGGTKIAFALALGIPGGGKGAGGGSGNKKAGGGAISLQTAGGAGIINFNPGVDIGISS
jgi:hypothetical protein